MTYVLDASAVLRYIDNQAGSERVAAVLQEVNAGMSRAVISAVHWGEIAGATAKIHGLSAVQSTLASLSATGIEVVAVTGDRAVRSALIKNDLKIPYADAFGVELARDSTNHVLMTADFDVKPAAGNTSIEFLPVKRSR